MLHNDLIGLVLFLGYIIAMGLPMILLKACFNVPFEVMRKMYHLVITLSIFPLVNLFNAWYMAVLAASLLEAGDGLLAAKDSEAAAKVFGALAADRSLPAPMRTAALPSFSQNIGPRYIDLPKIDVVKTGASGSNSR